MRARLFVDGSHPGSRKPRAFHESAAETVSAILADRRARASVQEVATGVAEARPYGTHGEEDAPRGSPCGPPKQVGRRETTESSSETQHAVISRESPRGAGARRE